VCYSCVFKSSTVILRGSPYFIVQTPLTADINPPPL
jgi:hypothetical protein